VNAVFFSRFSRFESGWFFIQDSPFHTRPAPNWRTVSSTPIFFSKCSPSFFYRFLAFLSILTAQQAFYRAPPRILASPLCLPFRSPRIGVRDTLPLDESLTSVLAPPPIWKGSMGIVVPPPCEQLKPPCDKHDSIPHFACVGEHLSCRRDVNVAVVFFPPFSPLLSLLPPHPNHTLLLFEKDLDHLPSSLVDPGHFCVVTYLFSSSRLCCFSPFPAPRYFFFTTVAAVIL